MQPQTITSVVSPRPLPPGAGLGGAAPWRRAFSLVELLVVVSIILVLMALTGAAVSGARSSQKKQATQALIAKLDAVIQQQYVSYGGRNIANAASADDRAVKLRQLISGDLPDRWVDVQAVATDPKTAHQRAYQAFWNSMSTKPNNQFASAECLFMIIMRGGIANCLNCSDLANERIGDKDEDGAFEFWDAWENPISLILWPAALELPAGTGEKFFSNVAPFAPTGSGRTMRPLIYSAGPDGEYDFETQIGSGNLAAGLNCGNPAASPTAVFGRPLGSGANDNLTNFDAEAKR